MKAHKWTDKSTKKDKEVKKKVEAVAQRTKQCTEAYLQMEGKILLTKRNSAWVFIVFEEMDARRKDDQWCSL